MPVLRQLNGCLFSARVVKRRNKPRAPRAGSGGNRPPEYPQTPDRGVRTILQVKSPASRYVGVVDRMTIEIENLPADCDHGHDVLRCVPIVLNSSGQPHPRALNIMLMVSDETHDRTAADSVRPSAENSDTMARSDRMVASCV